MTVIEAFSEGTPVIAPSNGNAGSLIKDGINGFKYDNNSIDNLVECIRKSATSNNLNISTIENYRNNYTDKININLIENIYKEVTTNQNGKTT